MQSPPCRHRRLPPIPTVRNGDSRQIGVSVRDGELGLTGCRADPDYIVSHLRFGPLFS